jgi:hypothetical protein
MQYFVILLLFFIYLDIYYVLIFPKACHLSVHAFELLLVGSGPEFFGNWLFLLKT